MVKVLKRALSPTLMGYPFLSPLLEALLNRFAVEDSRRYEHFGANQQTS
jgi:hypothetical protein